MIKLSREQRDQIITKFSNGETSPNIAEEFDITASRVCQIVKQFKVKRPRRKMGQSYKLTAKEYGEIRDLYISGINGREIARRYSLGSAEPYRILRRFNVKSRGPSEARRKLPLDETAFDKIAEESAYWVGFLMADGSVKRKGGSYQICLGLAIKDKKHVEKFKKFLKCGHKIRLHHYTKSRFPNSTPSVSLVIQSRKLADALAKYGVVPNKTFIAKAKGGMERNRHFWRGVIDGDGHLDLRVIYKKPVAFINLVGAKPLLLQFLKFAHRLLPECAVKIISKQKSFSVSFISSAAWELTRELYNDCSIALERKLKTAQDILSLPHPRSRQRLQISFTWPIKY